ncbi:MAG TPA: peptide ABC transporter substrate-binding protein [Candidatus Acutalibacter ornithocaccae]|uniref:Peptide ABC transporter substrate-binding protein n=1 Tax=Candidatus Acutalibacter ornithocaccae TaxID=2838416 RepID=A0A9D2LZC0_9FIRM|nr:peptide ABC transporter substrate-binding protein [Candidatus Acutalibacter ornithocaccae]
MKFRKILAMVMALALLCATFAACGDTSGTSSSAGTSSTASDSGDSSAAEEGETATGGSGGTLNMRNTMEPTSLNTLLATYAYDFTPINAMIECLYRDDENDVPQPAGAETVDISDDKLVYTFHLREDATWSNGDPVVATDYEFAWQQALNPEVASDYAYMLYFIHNAEPYFNGEVEWSEVGVKVIDEYTLEVTLDNPLPYATDLFAFPTLAPINQKFYEEVGADKYATDAEYFCCNGMYELTEWSHNSQIVFQKREDYWNADAVGPDEIVYKIITDSQAGLNSYLSREIDYTDLDSGEVVQQAEAAGFEVGVKPARSSYYLIVNTEDEFMSNQNLRLALAYAIDKQALIDTVYQNDNQPMTSFTPPAIMGAAGADGPTFQEALLEERGEMYPASGDLEKAQEYLQAALEELGCTVDELNLSIDCADDSLRRNCATFLQEQWRQNLGIENIAVNSMQTKQVSANRQSGDYCMSLGGWSPDYNDAINFLDLWVTDGGNNDSFWGNEEYDNLIAQATAEADVEVRQQYLFDAEEILAAEMPIIPLYWQCQNYSYNSDKIVDGAIITANQTTFYYATLAE